MPPAGPGPPPFLPGRQELPLPVAASAIASQDVRLY